CQKMRAFETSAPFATCAREVLAYPCAEKSLVADARIFSRVENDMARAPAAGAASTKRTQASTGLQARACAWPGRAHGPGVRMARACAWPGHGARSCARAPLPQPARSGREAPYAAARTVSSSPV